MLIRETFAANVPKLFHIPGDYFYLAAVPIGLVSVTFARDSRVLYEDLTLVTAGWSARPKGGFDSLSVVSTVAQDVSFYVSRGEVTRAADPDIIGTTKDVPQGHDRIVASGQAYLGRSVAAALAANVNLHQVWNPAANNRQVYIDRVDMLSSPAVEAWEYGIVGSAGTTQTLNPTNKRAGNGVAGCEMRYTQQAAGLYTGDGYTRSPLDGIATLILDPPILLPAGQSWGFTVSSLTVNQPTRCTFYLREYA